MKNIAINLKNINNGVINAVISSLILFIICLAMSALVVSTNDSRNQNHIYHQQFSKSSPVKDNKKRDYESTNALIIMDESHISRDYFDILTNELSSTMKEASLKPDEMQYYLKKSRELYFSKENTIPSVDKKCNTISGKEAMAFFFANYQSNSFIYRMSIDSESFRDTFEANLSNILAESCRIYSKRMNTKDVLSISILATANLFDDNSK